MPKKLELRIREAASREIARREEARGEACKCLVSACEACVHRRHGGGCIGTGCSIHRILSEMEKVRRMSKRQRIDTYSWAECQRLFGRCAEEERKEKENETKGE